MRSRLVMLLAVLLAAAGLTLTAARLAARTSTPAQARASLSPSLASYLGVYEDGSPPDFAPVAGFTRTVSRQPNLVGYFSGWAQPFASSFAEKLHDHGIIPFVQIDPTYASVPAIAAGEYDDYLRTYAASVRAFGHAVVLGFGHEMNAPWYSWGYGHVRPAVFVAAWRHIVSVFRSAGAGNVTWLWTINQDRPGTGPIASWWPGAKYVTWVGIDGYYFRPSDTFASVFGTTIQQVRTLTSKPILLSETAVGPDAGQFTKISDLFSGMRRYRTLGLVWFDKVQHDGIYHQDWRIENDPQADAAFRLGLSELNLARP
jgi:mannan endo-1,4-beta-mannosidase